jgi:glutathione S-transferase
MYSLGRSSVITDGDRVIAESGAIVDYLMSTYSDGRFAGVLGIKPRYTRFQSPVSLSVAGRPVEKGTGILEYYEFQ